MGTTLEPIHWWITNSSRRKTMKILRLVSTSALLIALWYARAFFAAPQPPTKPEASAAAANERMTPEEAKRQRDWAVDMHKKGRRRKAASRRPIRALNGKKSSASRFLTFHSFPGTARGPSSSGTRTTSRQERHWEPSPRRSGISKTPSALQAKAARSATPVRRSTTPTRCRSTRTL